MSAAGPGHLNEEASLAYKQLSKEEREHLRKEAGISVKKMTTKDVMKRGEKIFAKMQLMVSTSVRLWYIYIACSSFVHCAL